MFTQLPLASVREEKTTRVALDYFESAPGELPDARYCEHHLLLNLNDAQDFEQYRNGKNHAFTLGPEDWVITPSGIKNGWKWTRKSKVVVARILPSLVREFAVRESESSLTPMQLVPMVGVQDALLANIARALIHSNSIRRPPQSLLKSALIDAFLAALVSQHGEFGARTIFHRQRKLTAREQKIIQEFVLNHLGENLKLEDLGAQLGLSTYHFARCFKATTGVSPHQYVLKIRIDQAKSLIRDRRIPIVDVALALGFSDQSHFTRVFQRLAGVSPLAYRKGLT